MKNDIYNAVYGYSERVNQGDVLSPERIKLLICSCQELITRSRSEGPLSVTEDIQPLSYWFCFRVLDNLFSFYIIS